MKKSTEEKAHPMVRVIVISISYKTILTDYELRIEIENDKFLYEYL